MFYLSDEAIPLIIFGRIRAQQNIQVNSFLLQVAKPTDVTPKDDPIIVEHPKTKSTSFKTSQGIRF